jgi:hypothetical protein
MRDRLVVIGGFVYMTAGLIYLAWCTLEVHRLQAHMAALVGRF